MARQTLVAMESSRASRMCVVCCGANGGFFFWFCPAAIGGWGAGRGGAKRTRQQHGRSDSQACTSNSSSREWQGFARWVVRVRAREDRRSSSSSSSRAERWQAQVQAQAQSQSHSRLRTGQPAGAGRGSRAEKFGARSVSDLAERPSRRAKAAGRTAKAGWQSTINHHHHAAIVPSKERVGDEGHGAEDERHRIDRTGDGGTKGRQVLPKARCGWTELCKPVNRESCALAGRHCSRLTCAPREPWALVPLGTS